MEAPTYKNMGDHTETVQVDYDPQQITYEKLLAVFWNSHQPSQQSWSQQYKNAVFFHNEQQRRLAMDSKKILEKKTGKTVKTAIVPLNSFTMAEDYHQKYLLKHHPLKKGILDIYPHHKDLIASTAAARLNGYAGGYGNQNQLAMEIESLGLGPEGKQLLTDLVHK